MLAREFKCLALVFAAQLLLILIVDTLENGPFDWLAGVCMIGAYVLPFVAYIAFLYRAPMFTTMSNVLKMVCLTLISFCMTMTGTIAILILWFVVSAITGLPVRR